MTTPGETNPLSAPPPIPKIDHFFLDNTMIVTPVEKAIENWESYFESTLDAALRNHYGEASHRMLYRLLAKNGDLLRLCSPEARDNDQLVARAKKNYTVSHPIRFKKAA